MKFTAVLFNASLSPCEEWYKTVMVWIRGRWLCRGKVDEDGGGFIISKRDGADNPNTTLLNGNQKLINLNVLLLVRRRYRGTTDKDSFEGEDNSMVLWRYGWISKLKVVYEGSEIK